MERRTQSGSFTPNDPFIQNAGTPCFLFTAEQLTELLRSTIRAELNARFPEEEAKRDEQPSSDLLTVDEAAKLLDVHRVTLNTWEKRGFLTPVRLGRRVYYRRADIDAALISAESFSTHGNRRSWRAGGANA